MRTPVAAVFLSFLLVLALPAAAAEPRGRNPENPFSFHSEIDLYLGLKAGAEYHFSEFWGLRGAAGFCVISPLQASYALVGVRHLLPSENSLQLDIQMGLIQCIFNVLEPFVDLDPVIDQAYAYWVPGICASVGYRGPSGHSVSVRLGGGLIVGYDLGQWQGPNLHLNIALEYGHYRR